MTPLKIALLAAGAFLLPASPAIAQHAGHAPPAATPAPAPPSTACTPEHAAMGHCTIAAPAPAAPPGGTCTPEHAAMGHCKMSEAAAPAPAAACTAEHAAMGHCKMPEAAPRPAPATTCTAEHAAMGHCTMPAPAVIDPMTGPGTEAAGTDLPAGNAPPPPLSPANAGDAIFGREAMHMGRHHLSEHHGGQKFYQVMANKAEHQFGKGRDSYEWDAAAWYGGDINRFWLKSEGEGAAGGPLEKAEVQALYSRAVGVYSNLQGGIRYDFRPNPSRAYATIGIETLAPSFFDVEGALFLSNKGEILARAEGSYDQRITQRLILQPSAELNFAAQNSRKLGIGAGLSDAEIGIRLRYDIRRQFAPYVGVQYRRAFGDTRRFLRDEGEAAAGWSLLTGVRAWF